MVLVLQWMILSVLFACRCMWGCCEFSLINGPMSIKLQMWETVELFNLFRFHIECVNHTHIGFTGLDTRLKTGTVSGKPGRLLTLGWKAQSIFSSCHKSFNRESKRMQGWIAPPSVLEYVYKLCISLLPDGESAHWRLWVRLTDLIHL